MSELQDVQCPFCSHWSLNEVVKDEVDVKGNKAEFSRLDVVHYVCKNHQCGQPKITISVIGMAPYVQPNGLTGKRLSIRKKVSLWPESSAKSVPSYIPVEIADSYREACMIVDLSPKASATLSRRCLQGMIRDFWTIVDKPNLHQEIEAIKDLVAPDTWDAIMSVKSIGNIGAHMEKDVNLIIDIEPEEATLLISLNEQLFEDWYITRERRKERSSSLIAMAQAKNPKSPIVRPTDANNSNS